MGKEKIHFSSFVLVLFNHRKYIDFEFNLKILNYTAEKMLNFLELI